MTRSILKQVLRKQEGTIAIEMALIASTLAFLVLALVDLATVAHNSLTISEGLRSAAVYANDHPSDTSGIQQVFLDATNLSQNNLTLSNNQSCTCDSSEIVCGTTCSGSAATYNTVTVTYNVTLPVSFVGFSNPWSVTKNLVVRVK